MRRSKLAAVAFLFSISAPLEADPQVECPRVILSFRNEGYNFGTYYLCKSVHVNPEPPNYITCDVGVGGMYYDVGEYVASTNKWWVYSPNADMFDNMFINPDGSCPAPQAHSSRPRR